MWPGPVRSSVRSNGPRHTWTGQVETRRARFVAFLVAIVMVPFVVISGAPVSGVIGSTDRGILETGKPTVKTVLYTRCFPLVAVGRIMLGTPTDLVGSRMSKILRRQHSGEETSGEKDASDRR